VREQEKTMTDQECQNGNCAPCGLREFERNRYFDGKFLTERDFTAEQAYLTGKHRLHNTFLHGFGTVCGLKVSQHPNPACRHQFVVLSPGLAIDCCGNEIVVPEEITVDIRQLIRTALEARNRFNNGNPARTNVYLRLAYQECDAEPVAALLDDCEGCDESQIEFNRTREKYRLFADLDDPVGEAGDPLETRLDWQHTLETAVPRGIAVDRDRNRLYVVDWDTNEGRLRVYDTEHHNVVVSLRIEIAVEGGTSSAEPTAVAYSPLLNWVYVALAGADDRPARIQIMDRRRLEGDEPGSPLRAELTSDEINANIVRIESSPLDNSLFAVLANGRVLRWSSDALEAWANSDGAGTEPSPSLRDLATAEDAATPVTPNDAALSTDGRWLIVSDSSAPRVIVVNLSAFAEAANWGKAFALPAVPTALDLTYDGEYLYILCAAARPDQHLYRVQLGAQLSSYLPRFDSESNRFSVLPLSDSAADDSSPQAVDVVVTPRDRWVYVLRQLFDAEGTALDRGEIVYIAVELLESLRSTAAPLTPDAAAAHIRFGTNVEDIALFQTLAFYGQRLYVAGATPVVDAPSTAGSISILYINEATCDTIFRRSIDGCDSCDSAETGVILMSIPQYTWDQRIIDPAPGASGNIIDNYTHRHILPSTDTLREVIECMLAQGFNEGVPGPRGPQGERGPRGATIQTVTVTSLPSDAAPTATLTPIPGDPEGDQRLALSLPRGAPGVRGPGITQATVQVITSGSSTATLTPIPGDPEGDQRLDLRLVVPQAQLPNAPHITAASWYHDEVLNPETFVNRFGFLRETDNLGFVVAFDTPIRTETLHQRSFFALVRRVASPFETDVVLPMEVEYIDDDFNMNDVDIRWLHGNTTIPEDITRNLITSANVVDGDPRIVRAVRLVIPRTLDIANIRELGITRVTIIMRGDYVLGENGVALDGNNIWPGVPDIKSGNGAPGDDWVSIIHILQGD
jgi:DNA-binding beta-propeller fold protein YncE